jgi:hypothetical protein
MPMQKIFCDSCDTELKNGDFGEYRRFVFLKITRAGFLSSRPCLP